MKKQAGYQSLIVYQQAVIIYDLNAEFCGRFLENLREKRTIEQMVQAARSGKQNIVEASLEKSLKMNIKLTGVARASFGELLEDYKDFLRVRKLAIWDKDDKRLAPVRKMRIRTNETNGANWSNWTNGINGINGANGTDGTNWINWTYWTSEPERFANLMITLISKENYLLDKMIRSLEEKFVKQGGYSENLTKRRLDEKKKQLFSWTRRRWD